MAELNPNDAEMYETSVSKAPNSITSTMKDMIEFGRVFVTSKLDFQDHRVVVRERREDSHGESGTPPGWS